MKFKFLVAPAASVDRVLITKTLKSFVCFSWAPARNRRKQSPMSNRNRRTAPRRPILIGVFETRLCFRLTESRRSYQSAPVLRENFARHVFRPMGSFDRLLLGIFHHAPSAGQHQAV